MNENFYQKLQSKDGFSNPNIQVIDCSNKFRNNIANQNYRIL